MSAARAMRGIDFALAAAVALLAGGLLLSFGLPRGVAAALVAPHDALMPRLAAGDPLVAPQLTPAVAAHVKALAWHDSAHLHQRLGQLHFALARASASPAARLQGLRQSAAAHVEALARNPMLPYAWTQLALARLELAGPGPDFAAAYARAVEVSPALPALVFGRVRAGLAAWPRLDPATRDLLADDVAVAAKIDPRRLIRAAGTTNRLALLQRLLSAHPALLADVARAMRQPRPRHLQ